MGRWKLWFVLLLLLMFHIDSKEVGQLLVKNIGRKPDVTPLCTNETQSILTLIVCKIRTERSRGEECRLLYQHGQDFVHECDSRFTLMKENHTVFLHLTSLTPEDSGNYTCECSHLYGTDILHLNITVEEDEDDRRFAEIPFPSALIGVTTFIVITGFILGFIHRKNHHRKQLELQHSHQNTEPQDTEPCGTFIQKENVLYSACSFETSINYLPEMTQI
ncbi:uncharacterized protein LOC119903854 [Micropterus salmoides]|uniref:uncharacterized protein LOC119903854 n=1 Tax=Micropterus salmoides TaxID=27706 RepID=UPI0018EB947C|nr:uncharacterized protein LOC119903854 [Micropterus salmoides]